MKAYYEIQKLPDLAIDFSRHQQLAIPSFLVSVTMNCMQFFIQPSNAEGSESKQTANDIDRLRH
jgi:hypothetical protein